MSRRFVPRLIITWFVVFVFAIPTVSAAYATGGNVSPAVSPNVTNKNSLWAGYGVEGPAGVAGLVQSIFVSFIQPTVFCNSSLPKSQVVRFLGGIDGVIGTIDYAYVGTQVFCAVGSSTPVYGAVSSNGSIFATVHPGDKILAEVNVSGSFFGEGVADITTGTGGMGLTSVIGAKLIAAECVVSSGSDPASGLPAPLAQFSKAKFGMDYAGFHIFPTCNATVNGVGGFGQPIGAIGGLLALQKYVMYNSALSIVRAKPSALTPDLSSFKVTWKSYGP